MKNVCAFRALPNRRDLSSAAEYRTARLSLRGIIMKFLSLALAAALSLGSFSLAMAACSPEEAQNKAMAFAQAMQNKAQSAPNSYAGIMQELQPKLLELQQKQDMEALCRFYDEALEKLK